VIVTFRTKAHADITMFGNVAVELLKLAGLTGNVPTAILGGDVPRVLGTLESALAAHRAAHGDAAPSAAESRAASASREDQQAAEALVPLRNRALPLLERLRAAAAAKADVLVTQRR